MDAQLSNVPPPQEPDHPEPLPPVRGHGFVLERLLSVNGLISLGLLTWGAAVLRRPSLARNTWRAFCRRFPWFVGGTPRA